MREAAPNDAGALWRALEPVLRAGETYPQPPDIGYEAAMSYWFAPGHSVFVAEEGGDILGSYYLRANQPGQGAHVANCGYIVRPDARGRGVGRRLGEHSYAEAKRRGFTAMQYNFVVSTNTAAVHLWQALGMEIIGTLPGAFAHPTKGFVDAYVMYRRL